jgi:hypothetical protein
MSVKLNRIGFEYAKELVAKGMVVRDERDAWSENQPTTAAENEFIRLNGFREYPKWHLAIDDDQDPDTKNDTSFPTATSKRFTVVEC